MTPSGDQLKQHIEALTDRVVAGRVVARSIVEGQKARAALKELRKERAMPEVGGRKLASDFSSMMADLRKSIDDSKQVVADAVAELKGEIVGGARDAANALRKEAADVRKGFGELLGNGEPADGGSSSS